MDKTLPEIIRKVNDEGGVLMYEDEASFQVSGTIARGWIRKGRKNGKEVESKPTRDSVKTFGAVTVSENPKFHFLFTNIYNAQRFLAFLKRLVRRYPDRKIRMVVDNARYHHARLVTEWLEKNIERIELHFLPPYSPQLNAQECVWRVTRRKSTHSRFFNDKDELHKNLFRRFNRFQGNPASLRSTIAPFWNMMTK